MSVKNCRTYNTLLDTHELDTIEKIIPPHERHRLFFLRKIYIRLNKQKRKVHRHWIRLIRMHEQKWLIPLAIDTVIVHMLHILYICCEFPLAPNVNTDSSFHFRLVSKSKMWHTIHECNLMSCITSLSHRQFKLYTMYGITMGIGAYAS